MPRQYTLLRALIPHSIPNHLCLSMAPIHCDFREMSLIYGPQRATLGESSLGNFVFKTEVLGNGISGILKPSERAKISYFLFLG